jgi:deoxyribose-phosphate aldolase
MKVQNLAKLFDHSIVRPNATTEEVIKYAETAARLKTASLVVQPHYIRLAVKEMQGTGVLVGSVVGFPHGNETPAIKAYQANAVLDLGTEEIDMVMNIPALKNCEKEIFIEDIQGVVHAAQGVKVKVITENCYLTKEEKWRACQWIAEAGAHFVKTATAFADGGATLDDVRLMVAAVAGRCQVKAAGGIRQINEVLEFLRAGARRFGSSRTDQLVQAYQDLPEERKDDFGEFLVDLAI